MPGPQYSEKVISVALGKFLDPDYRAGIVEPAEERAGIVALSAGLEDSEWNALRASGFNPTEAGKVVLRLAEQIEP